MQTGIFYWFGYSIPPKERLKKIALTGFNNVSLWWGNQFVYTDGPKELLPEMARQTGLFVENIHTDPENTNLLWLDKQGWENVFGRYMSSIEACYNHQIPTMVLHLTSGINPPLQNELGIERIKHLVDRAEQRNVNIALENIRNPEYLDYVYQHIQSDKLKFCYDSGHENCFSKNEDLLDKFGKKLIALHLSDNDGIADQHRLPGDGNIEWIKLAQKLKKCHYSGSISLELTELTDKHRQLNVEQFLFEAYKQAKCIAELCK